MIYLEILEGTTVNLRYEAGFQYNIPSSDRWTVREVDSSVMEWNSLEVGIGIFH